MENITDLGALFEQVQLLSIFPDGKTFVDCTPLYPISDIRNRYQTSAGQQGFDLMSFVHENFKLPEMPSADYESVAGRPLEEHIDLLWEELTREAREKDSSLIPLPHAYIVPGGRFREMFYWDSYFTMLGLAVSGKIRMMGNMVENFSYLIDKLGYIPNGNRTYFMGRSQPPFYACMVNLLSQSRDVEGSETGQDILIKYLPQLEKEYSFWMSGLQELHAGSTAVKRVMLMPDGNILNRYWDESDLPRPESYKEDIELAKETDDKPKLFRNIRAACESGWDFSSRWFKYDNQFTSIHTTEIIPVDLNCLLYNLETTIATAHNFAKNNEAFEAYSLLAKKRKDAINKFCWNEEIGYYFDYDHVAGELKTAFTLAGLFPLFFPVARPDNATRIVLSLEKYLLFPGGLQTTTKVTSQQWDAPNGWAPLHWIAVKGLHNYGFEERAHEIASRWISLNEKVYGNTGKMMEKYNVVSTGLVAGGGEYLSQDGFGWTNGVYLALKKLLLNNAHNL